MTAESIRRVLVVGAGTMGQQVGVQCALVGLEVVLYDTSAQAREAVLPSLRAYLAAPMAAGTFTENQVEGALARLTITGDANQAAREVDLLSESIPEDPRLKGAVLGEFHRLCPPRAIFTTNTSTLTPSQFAKATGRPERFCAFHFHTPVWYANVVDVMPHPGTAPEVVDTLRDFAGRIGQIPRSPRDALSRSALSRYNDNTGLILRPGHCCEAFSEGQIKEGAFSCPPSPRPLAGP